MKVLLTGASGFVGSHLAEALARAGHELRLSLRGSSSDAFLTGIAAERVTLDLAEPETADAACRGAEAVVHAAGITRARREADFFRVNAEGTLKLAEAAARQGVRRFVFVSSLEARGPDQLGRPDSPYGESKLAAEEGLRAFQAALELVVLRPAGIYGPRDKDLLTLFRLAERGVLPRAASGHPFQPIYASDVAGAVVRALDAPAAFGPFALAEPRAYAWPELRGALEGALGRRVRLVTLPDQLYLAAGAGLERLAKLGGRAPPLDARRARAISIYSYTCDPGAAETALGWRAEVPLAEGLARTAAWYRAHGWL